MHALTTRVERIESHAGRSGSEMTDRSAWEWYAESCPCCLPAEEGSAHLLMLRCFETEHVEGLSPAGGRTGAMRAQAIEMGPTHHETRIEQTSLGATGRTRPVFFVDAA